MERVKTSVRFIALAVVLAVATLTIAAVAGNHLPLSQQFEALADEGLTTPGLEVASTDGDLDDGDGSSQEEESEEPEVVIAPSLSYRINLQGEQKWRTAAPSGNKTALNAFKVTFDPGTRTGGVKYRCHLKGASGWEGWVESDATAGKLSKKACIDSVQMKLTGAVAEEYDLAYRVNVKGAGWGAWVSGNNVACKPAGSAIIALQLKLVSRPPVKQLAKLGFGKTVADGVYVLSPKGMTSLRAQTAGASLKSGANVALTKKSAKALDQKWAVTWKSNGYEVRNANSGLALEAAGGAKNLLANVRQAKPSKTAAQRWYIRKVATGSYAIVSASTGTVLAPTSASLSSMKPTGMPSAKVKSGTNLGLVLADIAAFGSNTAEAKAARASLPSFSVKSAGLVEPGTYQIMVKAKPKYGMSIPSHSVKSGQKAASVAAKGALGERFVIAKSGTAYTIQAVCSGMYLTAKGGRVVQAKASKAKSQRWKAVVPGSGGIQFVNCATGKAIAAGGTSSKAQGQLKAATKADSAMQRWVVRTCSMLPSGLFEFVPRKSAKLRLDVAGASLGNGSNVQVHPHNSCNCQKFTVVPVKGGAYRIGMSFGNMVLSVQGASKKAGANVRMERWTGSSAQLWIPVATNNGLRFKNKKSGKMLAFAAAKRGANVQQLASSASSSLTSWALEDAQMNIGDRDSTRSAVSMASGGGLRVSNPIRGFRISDKRWNRLVNAVNSCRARGISLGFVMVDCDTGFTVGFGADRIRFGASTVKGLYVTYLFEEYLEKGRLSWGSISNLAYRTIVWSDNYAYRTLRASYGSEGGFRAWLSRSGMLSGGNYGGDVWGSYSARQLAYGWTQAVGYLSSGGKYVKKWKWLFSRSDHSFIHEALGGSRATYTKPGWMFAGSWSGTIMNDAGVVDNRKGKRYLLSFITNADPSSRYLVGRVAKALDGIEASLPKTRVR